MEEDIVEGFNTAYPTAKVEKKEKMEKFFDKISRGVETQIIDFIMENLFKEFKGQDDKKESIFHLKTKPLQEDKAKAVHFIVTLFARDALSIINEIFANFSGLNEIPDSKKLQTEWYKIADKFKKDSERLSEQIDEELMAIKEQKEVIESQIKLVGNSKLSARIPLASSSLIERIPPSDEKGKEEIDSVQVQAPVEAQVQAPVQVQPDPVEAQAVPENPVEGQTN